MTERSSAAVVKNTGGPDPLLGRVISDRFKITALIARGGMGKVYRAEQSPLGRVCAVKVLNPAYAGEHDPEFHKRFFLEASIASKLTHPNTVTIFDYGRTEDEIYYMAMEYLDGHTLHRAIREATHFPEDRAAHIARQVCRALREAHSLGVIHRDLKPANIFLVEHGDETDFVKVLDFGLVKNVSGDGKGDELTQTGLFMGSPKYMAPEQIRGDKVDARTDIYALGIIIYEMLTGKVPFDRPNSVNILMAHVNEPPPPLRQMNPNVNVSPAIEDTLARCMAKDPDQRFRSMDEVLAALKRIGPSALTATISGISTGEYRSVSGSGSGPQVATPPGGRAISGTNAVFVSPTGSDPGSIPAPLGAPTDAPPARALLVSQPPSKTGHKGMLLAGSVGALGLVAIVGYVALRPAKTVTATPATASSVPAMPPAPDTTTAVAPAPPAPPTVMIVKVRINSDPDGANVKEDGIEVCSSTPCDIVYKGSEADPTREHRLTLSRAGFRPESRTVKVGDTPVSVKLTLAPVGFRPVAPTPAKPESPAVPTGYKTEIPY
jgi:serine/threonine-protein kinase